MRRVRLGDVTLAVTEAGHGAPVLALHGFTGSAATWAGLAEALPGRRIVAPDLLGHGRSDAPADPARYALERQADDLAALLAVLSSARCDVVGYSMGARLALVLAIRHGGLVSRLVLESPSAGIADEEERRRRWADDDALARRIEVDGVAAFVETWEARPLLASHAALPETTRARLRSERLGQQPRGLAASLRGAGQGSMRPLHDAMASIDRPVLVIAGALDRVGLERARLVAAGLPEARLEVVAAVGHTPHLEQPDAFHRLVRDALLPASIPMR